LAQAILAQEYWFKPSQSRSLQLDVRTDVQVQPFVIVRDDQTLFELPAINLVHYYHPAGPGKLLMSSQALQLGHSGSYRGHTSQKCASASVCTLVLVSFILFAICTDGTFTVAVHGDSIAALFRTTNAKLMSSNSGAIAIPPHVGMKLMTVMTNATKRVRASTTKPVTCTVPAEAPVIPMVPYDQVFKRFAWLHIPKTGTSFVNVLAAYACNMQPNDGCLSGPGQWPDSQSGRCKKQFAQAPWLDLVHVDWHSPLNGGLYSQLRGSLVTMLRNPFKHKISYWKDKILNGQKYGLHHTHENYEHNFTAAWEDMRGMQTGMLVGKWMMHQVFQADLPMAKRRLREGFVFFGLTDRWDDSMCLFHALLGMGNCHHCEFVAFNTWAGKRANNIEKQQPQFSAEQQAYLDAYRDDLDEHLLQYAQEVFEELLTTSGATKEWCSICSCTSDSIHKTNW